jgi:predicted NBD/HSP70 family sugar kinase
MPEENSHQPTLAAHGALRLPSVIVDSYNLEAKDDDGDFIGDRASKGAFRDILEDWRKALRKTGDDPFGEVPTEDIRKKELDALLAEGDPEAAAVLQGAIEDFAKELAYIIRRFLKLKAWQDAECIAVGGGFRAARIGELAISRAEVILRADDVDIDLIAVRHHPDEAGLLGAAHLAPSWLFKGHAGILAVDIGGTNIRAGVVDLNLNKASDLSKARVWKYERWRHSEEEKLTREQAVERLVGMLRSLIRGAERSGIGLAPFIGIGCPGIINEDGSIKRGAQNLPGNWESKNFNLPASLREAIPTIGDHETAVIMHNDAVVQGLSEIPFMQDVEHWGVLTIGTGLGNARFTNRDPKTDKKKKKKKA